MTVQCFVFALRARSEPFKSIRQQGPQHLSLLPVSVLLPGGLSLRVHQYCRQFYCKFERAQ